MTTYDPSPIPTDEVSLPGELNELVEQLAASNHDHWAQRRIDEGWRYGPERNDADKTHPDLVPYEDLTEGEKEYDRTSVIETIKAILALGYSIDRSESSD